MVDYSQLELVPAAVGEREGLLLGLLLLAATGDADLLRLR